MEDGKVLGEDVATISDGGLLKGMLEREVEIGGLLTFPSKGLCDLE
jgi:hypothetical protein